jgi:hypothetical protein
MIILMQNLFHNIFIMPDCVSSPFIVRITSTAILIIRVPREVNVNAFQHPLLLQAGYFKSSQFPSQSLA